MRYGLAPRRAIVTFTKPSPRAQLVGLLVVTGLFTVFLLWLASL